MACHIITYDLKKQGQNYECLSEKIKSYGTWAHLQGSVWIVKSDKKSSEIRDHLKACLDENDQLFVAKLTGEAAWTGHADRSDWLKKHL